MSATLPTGENAFAYDEFIAWMKEGAERAGPLYEVHMSVSTAMALGLTMHETRAAALVRACRVPDSVPARTLGLWEVRRFDGPTIANTNTAAFIYRLGLAPYSTWTCLLRTTLATLGRDYGEPVMEDSPRELCRHLPILIAARGDVLVTGLGLGCVVRGLLSKAEVTHIDVVELDPHVVELTGAEFVGNPRVTLHVGDAFDIEWAPGTRWDYAWHDIWSETQPLALLHSQLLVRYRDMVRVAQGAWGMDRHVTRMLGIPLLHAKARQRRRPRHG